MLRVICQFLGHRKVTVYCPKDQKVRVVCVRCKMGRSALPVR